MERSPLRLLRSRVANFFGTHMFTSASRLASLVRSLAPKLKCLLHMDGGDSRTFAGGFFIGDVDEVRVTESRGRYTASHGVTTSAFPNR